MLRSVVADFKAAGHEITVMLDGRLSRLNPPLNADFIVPIFYSHEPTRVISKIAKINDAIYIIAPETGQTLQSFVALADQTGKISLNCQASAIAKAADKTVLYEDLQTLGVTPKTIFLRIDDGVEKARYAIENELGYPAVLKPADGVSCAGLSIVKKVTQIEKAFQKISVESTCKRFIAQEYVNGEAASISLLSTCKKTVALSLNKQKVNLSEPDKVSSYEGGAVPFEHPLKQKAFALAERVVESIPGLSGYVGVDFVLTQKKCFVVDVNPRLTTSYIALRKVASFNVAEALVNARSKDELPNKLENQGYSCFTKVISPKPAITAFQKAAESSAVISPPFPLSCSSQACSIVIGNGESLEEATLRLEEAKKRLLNIIN